MDYPDNYEMDMLRKRDAMRQQAEEDPPPAEQAGHLRADRRAGQRSQSSLHA